MVILIFRYIYIFIYIYIYIYIYIFLEIFKFYIIEEVPKDGHFFLLFHMKVLKAIASIPQAKTDFAFAADYLRITTFAVAAATSVRLMLWPMSYLVKARNCIGHWDGGFLTTFDWGFHVSTLSFGGPSRSPRCFFRLNFVC